MAWMIVKQPNGKMARWSDVVDNFTHTDMSENQAFLLCLEQMNCVRSAYEKTLAGKQDNLPLKICNSHGKGQERWNYCLEIISIVHGTSEVTRVEKIGKENTLLPPKPH